MFKAICIRRLQRTGAPIDLGFLAEAMLFYRDVHVVADSAVLSHLVRVCGPDSLIAALESGFLKLSYQENDLAINVVDKGRPTERYDPCLLSSPTTTLLPLAEKLFFESTGRTGRSRRLASTFARHVDAVNWTLPEVHAARDDLLDAEITDRAANIALREIAPGIQLPQGGLFRVGELREALHVQTNLDMAEAERCYKRLDPESDFGIASILLVIFEALADVRFSARFSSELAASSSTSGIAEIKLGRLLRQRQNNDERVRLFQEWTFSEGRAIRDAVNKNHRNFDDILRLVESAQRFKEWLAEQPDAVDVRQEYLREISRIDWVDKLPAKSFRWFLFSALGGALGCLTTPVTGILTGAALNAVDAFMIDRLAKGWKPSQFVEGPLKTFVDARAEG